jgi:hypothetical protein
MLVIIAYAIDAFKRRKITVDGCGDALKKAGIQLLWKENSGTTRESPLPRRRKT